MTGGFASTTGLANIHVPIQFFISKSQMDFLCLRNEQTRGAYSAGLGAGNAFHGTVHTPQFTHGMCHWAVTDSSLCSTDWWQGAGEKYMYFVFSHCL